MVVKHRFPTELKFTLNELEEGKSHYKKVYKLYGLKDIFLDVAKMMTQIRRKCVKIQKK